jgi:hypothetical protein
MEIYKLDQMTTLFGILVQNLDMKFYALCMVLILFLQACKKDQDPEISIETPSDHQEFTKGSTFNIKATFTDDKGLKSYHIHMGDEAGNHVEEFDFHDATEISGTSYSYNKPVSIPSAIGSVYYLHVEITDEGDHTTEEQLMLHFSE